jgi:hypothetical protein
VKLKLIVYVKFRGAKFTTNGAGWHGFIDMSTFGGKFQTGGLITTLLHELGHNLGQAYANKTVDPTYGRNAKYEIPGIPFPDGVPAGFVYGAHGHTGTHCAGGVPDNLRGEANFQTGPKAADIASKATCIMYGSADMNSATMRTYCENCAKFIRATEADDITKAWEAA